MEIFIIILIFVAIVVVFYLINKSSNDKQREEIIERRKNFVSAKSPTARIIVNNGVHFFYIDSERRYFGVDESDKTLDFDGLQSVSTFKDCISIIHNYTFYNIGKDATKSEHTVPLDVLSVSLIAAVVMPVLRENLHKELEKNSIIPTLEYEHEGTIWGCDLNTRTFYSTFAYIRLHKFFELRSVTVEDMSNNTLYDGNYIIRVSIKTTFDWNDDIDLTFYSKDAKFYDLLTMFKEIKKRGNR